ncbi:hypothetical protein MMC07_000834 [Pseudocyphellaria aurata]|nr:hypothetical protein [Pseudocyphellaria aurata]
MASHALLADIQAFHTLADYERTRSAKLALVARGRASSAGWPFKKVEKKSGFTETERPLMSIEHLFLLQTQIFAHFFGVSAAELAELVAKGEEVEGDEAEAGPNNA